MEDRSPSFQDPLEAGFETALALIEQSACVTSLQTALAAILRLYGFKHCVYHLVRNPSLDLTQEVVALTYPEDWVSHDKAKRYIEIDPAAQMGERALVPVDWDALDKGATPARRLFDESVEAGVGSHGLSIPIRGAMGEHAVFAGISDEADRDWRRIRQGHMAHVQGIAYDVHGQFSRIKHGNRPSCVGRLSSRERECLRWTASGKTIDGTATILGVSGSAVRSYLDSARLKLDCMTKTQAIARALQLGLIGF